MTGAVQVQIAKRDGSLEAFDAQKLRRCLASAMGTCRRDQRYADALVQAVLIHLRESPAGRPPTSEYVYRCCRTALAETGMSDVSDGIQKHRRERAAKRRRVTVARQNELGAPWRKELIVRSLERKFELTRSVARILAGEIEKRVLGLDYRVVTAALVIELIRNELSAWGLAGGASQAADPPQAAPLTVAHKLDQAN